MKGQSVVTRGPVQNKSYFEVSELFHCHLPLLTYYDDSFPLLFHHSLVCIL